MQFEFDMQKTLEAILYIINRTPMPSFMSVAKLLYFADKTSLEAYGCFVTGDTYVAMQYGPVPSNTYDIMKEARETEDFGFRVVYNHHLQPLREADLDCLSEGDIKCLKLVVDAYGKFPAWQLRDLSHDDAWQITWDEAGQRGNSPIPVERIASTLDNSEELIEFIIGADLD